MLLFFIFQLDIKMLIWQTTKGVKRSRDQKSIENIFSFFLGESKEVFEFVTLDHKPDIIRTGIFVALVNIND